MVTPYKNDGQHYLLEFLYNVKKKKVIQLLKMLLAYLIKLYENCS